MKPPWNAALAGRVEHRVNIPTAPRVPGVVGQTHIKKRVARNDARPLNQNCAAATVVYTLHMSNCYAIKRVVYGFTH
jgi:hypothetical protein